MEPSRNLLGTFPVRRRRGDGGQVDRDGCRKVPQAAPHGLRGLRVAEMGRESSRELPVAESSREMGRE